MLELKAQHYAHRNTYKRHSILEINSNTFVSGTAGIIGGVCGVAGILSGPIGWAAHGVGAVLGGVSIGTALASQVPDCTACKRRLLVEVQDV